MFVGSHKKGLLKHETILERDGIAKYIIPQFELRQIKNSFKSLKLKRGDVVFFNYLLVHGSASNASPCNQRRAILQFCTKDVSSINHGDDRRERENLSSPKRRVMRGGAFDSDRKHARVTARMDDLPDTRGFADGFRVVLVSSQLKQ